MSEDAKNLLLRLKKEKKINKQIELIQKLRDYNQEDIVNSVLLKHLESKDHDTLRLEILSVLNYDDEQIIKPLVAMVNNSKEILSIKEKAVTLLGQSRNKKAMKALMSASKKVKDPKLLDNIVYALTFFNDTGVVKPIIKALHNDELRIQVLTGLARNEHLVLTSNAILKELATIEITKSFEKLHHDQIINIILDEFKFQNKGEFQAAIYNKSINKKIDKYRKKQNEIAKALKKVS